MEKEKENRRSKSASRIEKRQKAIVVKKKDKTNIITIMIKIKQLS